MNTLGWWIESPKKDRYEMWAIWQTVVLVIASTPEHEGQVLVIRRNNRAEAEKVMMDAAELAEKQEWVMRSAPFAFDLPEELITEALVLDGDWKPCPVLRHTIWAAA